MGAPGWSNDAPAPFADFTFKRVGVPSSGQSRLNIQIDPDEQAKALAVGRDVTKEEATASTVPQEVPVLAFDWFWREVPHAVPTSGPGNLRKALDLLETRSDLAQPRLQHLQSIAEKHGLDILRATVGTPVSPALVLALISVESSGQTDAESTAGARGLMQLIPETAARFGVEDSNDPAQNIQGGVSYLKWLIEHFDGDAILALAGYNAGENAVKTHGGVPPYAETRAYVPKVLSAWRVARGLCETPPELISDGCVFSIKGASSNG